MPRAFTSDPLLNFNYQIFLEFLNQKLQGYFKRISIEVPERHIAEFWSGDMANPIVVPGPPAASISISITTCLFVSDNSSDIQKYFLILDSGVPCDIQVLHHKILVQDRKLTIPTSTIMNVNSIPKHKWGYIFKNCFLKSIKFSELAAQEVSDFTYDLEFVVESMKIL